MRIKNKNILVVVLLVVFLGLTSVIYLSVNRDPSGVKNENLQSSVNSPDPILEMGNNGFTTEEVTSFELEDPYEELGGNASTVLIPDPLASATYQGINNLSRVENLDLTALAKDDLEGKILAELRKNYNLEEIGININPASVVKNGMNYQFKILVSSNQQAGWTVFYLATFSASETVVQNLTLVETSS